MTQQLERRYVNQFLAEQYTDKDYRTRVWLGPLPPGKRDNEYMVVGKWADAVVIEPGQVTIIETKLEPNAEAVGQLDMYVQEFGKTARFSQYWRLPIKKMLVTTRVDDAVLQVCNAHNVEYRVFKPVWVEYWEKRRFRL